MAVAVVAAVAVSMVAVILGVMEGHLVMVAILGVMEEQLVADYLDRLVLCLW